MFRKTFFVVAALAALTVMATPAMAAKGGNSASAKKCQKGGWQNYVRADQTPFTSQADCTSYGANGGVLTAPAPKSVQQLACEALNTPDKPWFQATYEERVIDDGYGTSYFRCLFSEEGGTDLSAMAAYQFNPEVQAACAAYKPLPYPYGARLENSLSHEEDEWFGVRCWAYNS